MKSSLKFREEKSPLLRAKLPFKVGPIPLSSGIAVGNSQDLAVHLGTFFPAGPAIKVAFKPNGSSPLSVILKTGLGFWGSPNDSAFTLTAEFHIAPKGGDPLFSLRLKPRVGDFSIRKDVNGVNFLPAKQKEVEAAPLSLQVSENSEQSHTTTPDKPEDGAMSSPLSNRDAKAVHKRSSGTFMEKDRARSPSVDSNAVVIGSNFSLKIEGLEKERKGRGDREQKVEGFKEQDAEADMVENGNGVIEQAFHESLHEQAKMDSQKSSAAFSLAGAQSTFRGCRVVVHSSLPLGSQAKLNVRWGLKPPPEIFQGWDGSLPLLSLSKLPSLLLDKVSFERVSVPVEKPKETAPRLGNTGHLEQGLLPVSFLEENRELAQVAAMCYSMKRQLHLMYAENQVLRRAMEEMRSQVEFRGSWNSTGTDDGILTKELSIPRLPPKSSLSDASRVPRNEVEARKGQREMPRKDADLDATKLTFSMGSNADVSKELEKAIMSTKSGSGGGKKD